MKPSPRDWAPFVSFDPEEAAVVRRPPGEGAGYWAGAPAVTFDTEDDTFYLAYRLRRPRGIEPDRGAEVRLARSRDGLEFEDIWTGFKETLSSPSMERSAVMRFSDGMWGLYVSYVDASDNRWRIALVRAEEPTRFDLARAEPVLTAEDLPEGSEGLKDPFVFRLAGLYHMIVSYAVRVAGASGAEMHQTADVYNTGLIRSQTGLATSEDGRHWQWQGCLLAPNGSGWDGYCRRIGCVWYQPPVWLALYDGSADVSENYEERCGLAFSHDLGRFHCVTRQQPLITPLGRTGALRYFDVLQRPEGTYFYFEMARPDGSHDLRVVCR